MPRKRLIKCLSWPTLKAIEQNGGGDKQFGFGPISTDELKKRVPNINPIDNLAPLAVKGVTIFLIHGEQDDIVEIGPNSLEAERRFTRLGGTIEVERIKDIGHERNKAFYHHSAFSNS